MQTAIDLLTTLLPLLYALAMVNYIVYLVRGDPFSERTCTPFLTAVFLLHLAYFGLSTALYGRAPINSMPAVISAVALAVAGVYLYVERVQGSKVTGAFQLAMVVLLQLIASTLVQHAATPGSDVTSHSTFGLHVIAAILAHAAFFVGAVYAVMYVHLYRSLKRKKFGVVFERLPPLDTLANMGFGATALGWVLLTASIVVGVVLSRSVAGSFSEPHVLSAIGVWFVYGVSLLAYFVLGWRGARSVYLALAGFVVAVLTISGSAIWPMIHRLDA